MITGILGRGSERQRSQKKVSDMTYMPTLKMEEGRMSKGMCMSLGS
jgi:hypothetical protein